MGLNNFRNIIPVLLFVILTLCLTSSLLGCITPPPLSYDSNNSASTPILSPTLTPTPSAVGLSLWAEWQLDYRGEAAWSPDSQYVVLTDNNPQGLDDRTYLYEIDSLQQVWMINVGMLSITFSPDGKYIVSMGRGLHFFDAASGELIDIPYEGNAIFWPAFLPERETLLVGQSWILGYKTAKTEIGIWDNEQKSMNTILEHDGNITALTVSQDGKLLATAFALLPDVEGGRRVFLWDLATKSKRCDLPGEDATLSPTGNILATTEDKGRITLVDTSNCQSVMVIHEAGFIRSFNFSPDGQMLASSGVPYGVVWIHDVETGELMYQQVGLRELIDSISFSPNGKYLLFRGQGEGPDSNDSSKQVIQVWQVPDSANP